MIKKLGTITKINGNKTIDSKTGREAYSVIEMTCGDKFYFNSKTVIGGCKFKYLMIGDSVKIVSAKKPKLTGIAFAERVELLDITAKWEQILKSECNTSYKTYDAAITGYDVIYPEIVDTNRSHKVVRKLDTLNEAILAHSFSNDRWRMVMELYAQGKNQQEICDLTGHKHRSTVHRIIKKHLDLWGVE